MLITYRGQELLDCRCWTPPTITDWTADVKKTLPTVRDWTTGVEEHCLQLMPNGDTTHTFEVLLQSSAIVMICNYESSKEYVKYRVEWMRIHLYAIVE